MHQLTAERVEEIVRNLQGKTIAVIGDLMLDRYFWGSVSRISPEAPVPVIDIEHETFHPGGAANVAHNLRSLGISPILCGVVGRDREGEILRNSAIDSGLSTMGILVDAHRPTTVKTRIMGNNQHIARLDKEKRDYIDNETSDTILNVLSTIESLDGIIIEDYNKGVITHHLIQLLTDLSKSKNIPLFVDPKKNFFFEYKNATVFKPNRKEAQEALGYSLKSPADVERAGKELLKRLEAENILLTLGEEGMMLFQSNGDVSSVPTKARHIADVSGAGDTAIATLSAAIAGGASITEAAELANIGAGVVCEEPGIVSIRPSALIAALSF
jgi:rfaE bifunctional protein kinase chain/domain